ncbi:MAG: hypothetical protein Q9162_002643 [Coniocarpon cinnabarinum]
MTSPSVYLAISGLAATDWFPRLGKTTTMSYDHPNFVVSMLPTDLSSVVHHISGFTGPWQSELQTLISGSPTTGTTFMMTESAEPYNLFNNQRPVPASAYFFRAATPTYSGPNGIPTDSIIRNDYHAQISIPAQVSSIALKPEWDACSMALGGLYDPPQPIETTSFGPTGHPLATLPGCHGCAAVQPITEQPFTTLGTQHELPVQVQDTTSFTNPSADTTGAPVVTDPSDPGVQVINPQLQGPQIPATAGPMVPISNPGLQTNAVIQPQPPPANTGSANPQPQIQDSNAPLSNPQPAPQPAPQSAPNTPSASDPAQQAAPNGAFGLGSSQPSVVAPPAAQPASTGQPASAPAPAPLPAANQQQAGAAATLPAPNPQEAGAPAPAAAEPGPVQQAAAVPAPSSQPIQSAGAAVGPPAPQGNPAPPVSNNVQNAGSGQNSNPPSNVAPALPASGGSNSADGASAAANVQPGAANIGNIAVPPPQIGQGDRNENQAQAVADAPNVVIPLGPSSSAVAVQAPAVVNGQTRPNAVLIGSNTLVPGGPAATIGGQVVSAGPSGVIAGGNTISLATPAGNGDSGSVGILPLAPAGPSQGPVQNQNIDLGGGAPPLAAQIQQPPRPQPDSPQPAPIVALPGGATAVAGGAPASVDGHAISLAANGQSLVVDGSLTQAVTGVPFTPSNQANSGPMNPNAVQAITTTGADGIATTGDVVGGSTLLPNGPGAVIAGHTLSAATDGGVIVDGTSTARPLGSALSNGAFSLTLGPSSGVPQLVPDQATSIVGPNGQTTSAQIVGGRTIQAGQPAQTISGHQVSVAPNGALVVDSTPVAPNPAGMITLAPGSLPQTLPASSAVVTGDNGKVTTGSVIAGQTVLPGAPAQQIQGHAVSVAPNGQIFVDNQPTSAVGGALTIGPTMAPQTLSARSTSVTGANGQLVPAEVIEGSTLTPGATASISGHVFSVGSSGQIFVDGGATLAPDYTGHITVSNSDVLAGQQTIKTGADGRTTLQDVIGGRTLEAGGPASTISGHVVSLASNGAVIVDSTRTLMPSGAPLTRKPLAATFSVNGVPGSLTASSIMITGPDGKLTSADVIGSQTLTAGGPQAVISGHTVSLASDGRLIVDGTSTIPAATATQGQNAEGTSGSGGNPGGGALSSPTRGTAPATSSPGAAGRLDVMGEGWCLVAAAGMAMMIVM